MTTHPKVRQGHYCQLSQWYSTATSLCEKCPSATVLFQAPQTWSTLWTCCSFPTAKTNLRTAIDALIFWSVGFQGLNYRLLKRVRTLHTRLRSICSTSAALRVRAVSLQGIYIHCELDGICCCLRAQVVKTCLQTKFPSVEVHGWQLRSAGVHHVDIPRKMLTTSLHQSPKPQKCRKSTKIGQNSPGHEDHRGSIMSVAWISIL